jgi:DNA helicase-2/ATP-dependent DNA helicase PcrA
VQYALVDGHDEHRPNRLKVKEWLEYINQSRLLAGAFKEQYDALLKCLRDLSWQHEAQEQQWRLLPRSDDWQRRTSLNKIFTHGDVSLYKSFYWRDGIIDHEDVLYFAYRLLEGNPALRGFVSARFPYLFIDEFQDTIPVQTQVVQWLANEGTIVGVIGDPVQAIYQFIGAVPAHFSEFSLPQHVDYHINGNRRSTDKIIELLNHCRGPELQQVGLRAVPGEPVTVCVGSVEKIVPVLRERLGDAETLYILARKHDEAKSVRNLDNAGRADIWEELEAVDGERARFLEHIIAAGEFAQHGQFPLAFHHMRRSIRVRQEKVMRPLTGSAVVNELQRRGLAVSLLSFLISQYRTLQASMLLDVYEAFSEAITQHLDGIALQRVHSGKFKTFAETTPYSALSSTVHLTEENRIIRTIHQAKGAEFKNVLVYFSQAGERIQHILRPLDHQDEEARISFVAFSRAIIYLFIAFPRLSQSDHDLLQSLGLNVEIYG